MKSTTYIIEITNQKNEKCLWGEIQLLARFFASLPCVKKFFRMSLLKSVLPFLTNQAAGFISRNISHTYYSGHSFYGMTFRF